MKVLMIDEIKQKIADTSVAFGFFDGVHLGHQEIIRKMTATACKNKVVLTFFDHPERLLRGEDAVTYITTNAQKEALFEKMGVDYVVYIRFSEEVMALSPEEFVKKYLVDKFDLKKITVGFNNRFGKNGAGDSVALKTLGNRYGFDVEVVDAVRLDDVVVSSSLIRSLIAQGAVDAAARYLGRYYQIEDVVIEGKKLGRTIGVPTVNMAIQKNTLIPSSGVYVSRTYDGKRVFGSITNVGNNPTFENHPYRIETHVFDFHENVYDHRLTIEFIQKVREEKKFKGIDELKNQLYNDIDYAKNLLKSIKA